MASGPVLEAEPGPDLPSDGDVSGEAARLGSARQRARMDRARYAGDASVLLDKDRRIVEANERAEGATRASSCSACISISSSRMLPWPPRTTVGNTSATHGQLIDELLQFSRVSRAEMRADIDLSALTREVVAALRQGEATRRVDVVVQDDAHAVGDPRLLRLALENLSDNAWKFTSKREHATTRFAAEHDGEDLVYQVKDDGAGFETAYAHRLFAPFRRLHTGEQFPGTGVGLVTVQRTVRRHGGRAWVFVIPDEGATFSFSVGQG